MGNPAKIQYVSTERIANGVIGGGEDRGKLLIPAEYGFLHPFEHIAARGRNGGVSAENGCDLDVVRISHIGVPLVNGVVEGISGQLLHHNVGAVPVCVIALFSAHGKGHGVSVVVGGGQVRIVRILGFDGCGFGFDCCGVRRGGFLYVSGAGRENA